MASYHWISASGPEQTGVEINYNAINYYVIHLTLAVYLKLSGS